MSAPTPMTQNLLKRLRSANGCARRIGNCVADWSYWSRKLRRRPLLRPPRQVR